jgi:hypothetical protein
LGVEILPKQQNNGHQGVQRKLGRSGTERNGGEGYFHRRLVVITALVAVLAVGATAWASLTGRLAGLPYANIPLVHEFPPKGYFVNPFTGDPRDLVSSSEAARVRVDFVKDGDIEVKAFAHGDASLLSQARTGRALAKARDLMAADAANGVN